MGSGKSGRLRLGDTRAVFRLLGDVRDLRDQPLLQRQRMVDGLCQLVGGWVGFSVYFRNYAPDREPGVSSLITGGWPDDSALRILADYSSRGFVRDDPLVEATIQLNWRLIAARRKDLLDDRTIQQSLLYAMVEDQIPLGDIMIGSYRADDPTQVRGIALHRQKDEPAFSVRDRRMLRLFTVELYRLYREGKLDPPDQGPATLTPRQEQVLQRVLEGRSAKQVAAILGLSQRTVEEHIQTLYEKFGVASRPELMAAFIQPRNRMKPTS